MSDLNAVHLVVHEEAFEKRAQIKSNQIKSTSELQTQ
jgi:hypothetical protein